MNYVWLAGKLKKFNRSSAMMTRAWKKPQSQGLPTTAMTLSTIRPTKKSATISTHSCASISYQNASLKTSILAQNSAKASKPVEI